MTARQRRGVWAFTGLLAGLAVLLTLAGSAQPLGGPPAPDARWLAVVVLGVAACEWMTVSFVFRSDSHTFSFVDIPTTVAIAVFGARTAVLAVAIGLCVALAVQRHPLVRFAYNVAAASATAAAAFVVASAIVPMSPSVAALWLGAAAAVLACSPFSTLAVVAVRSIAAGKFQGEGVARMLVFGALTSLSSASFGALAGVAWSVSPLVAALVASPIVLLYAALRLYMSERLERSNVEFLYETTRVLEDADELETGLAEVLERARRVFRCEYAEVAITRRGGEWLRVHSGDGDRPEAGEFLTADRARATIGAVRVVTRRHDSADPLLVGLSARDAMATSFEMQNGAAVGVLVVADRVGTPVVFDRTAQRQFGAFAAQIAVSLENGELEQSLDRLTRIGEDLRHQANHDALTGLANRSMLASWTSARQAALAVLAIDLDDFKPINDRLGHDAGDQVLIHVASVLRSAVSDVLSSAETLVVRLGGDEFAVVLLDGELTDAALVGGRILDGLTGPMVVSGSHLAVHASIGIAAGDTADLSEALHRADLAMYEAKRRGKSRLSVYRTDLDPHAASLSA